jgi:hypothetical protein
MLFGFFDRVSSASAMRTSLDASWQRVRGISQRVAAASVDGTSGFTLPDGATSAEGPVDLEAEMTRLADESLRIETTSKLLERTYSRIRLSIRERA